MTPPYGHNASRSAAIRRSRTAGSYSRAGTTPQIGFGQAGSPRRRAMMWTWSCGTMLPSAATLSLSQGTTALSARHTTAISRVSSACPGASRSMISLTPSQRGTRMSQGKLASLASSKRDSASSPTGTVSASSCGCRLQDGTCLTANAGRACEGGRSRATRAGSRSTHEVHPPVRKIVDPADHVDLLLSHGGRDDGRRGLEARDVERARSP